jgi:tetratricopeptide (TPR) repeat protein
MGLAVLASCAQDEGIGDRYRAEQMYYRANTLYQTLQIGQGEFGPERYRQIRRSFRRLLVEYPVHSLRSAEGYTAEIRQELLVLTGTSQMNVADLFLQEGQIDSAIATYQRVISHYKDQRSLSSQAQYSIALAYQSSDRWSDAVAAFEAILEEYPPYEETPQTPNVSILEIPNHLAATYLSRGDSAQAGEYFNKARDYYSDIMEKWPGTPTATMAQNQIAQAYVLQEQWSPAISALERLVSLSPEGGDPPDALFMMATIYSERLGDLGRAKDIYEEILRRYPDSEKVSRAYLAMGYISLQKGDLQDARRAFVRVIEDYPSDPVAGAGAQYALALSYEFEGDWDKALNEFRWILDNYPASREALAVPTHILEHYLQYGEEELAVTAHQQALRIYGEIIAQNPGTPLAVQARWHIARSHMMMENWEGAAAALELLVEEHPQSQHILPALMSLGEIYELHLKKIDRAIQAYQLVRKMAPASRYANIAARHIDRLQKTLP